MSCMQGEDFSVIFVEPFFMMCRHEFRFNEFLLNGDHGKSFESEHFLSGEEVCHVDFSDSHDVFDSDSEGAIFVESWFVADEHAGFESGLDGCASSARVDGLSNALWSLMDA